jgi:lysylphosphatidylglycerol synthetase-like protein (DUF2156 family)
MSLDFLYIWLGVMLVAVIAAPIVRNRRKKTALDERDFVVTGFALGSAIALTKVLLKVIADKKLQTDLDWDGTVGICISCGLGIYLSLKEVIKLF